MYELQMGLPGTATVTEIGFHLGKDGNTFLDPEQNLLNGYLSHKLSIATHFVLQYTPVQAVLSETGKAGAGRSWSKSHGEHFPICTPATSVTPGRARDVLTQVLWSLQRLD